MDGLIAMVNCILYKKKKEKNSKIMIFVGNSQVFFSGDHRGDHICQCGETNDCIENGVEDFVCNCDSNLPTFLNDEGLITAKDLLPITQVYYGPLLFEAQNASFTVGKLRCSGMRSY